MKAESASFGWACRRRRLASVPRKKTVNILPDRGGADCYRCAVPAGRQRLRPNSRETPARPTAADRALAGCLGSLDEDCCRGLSGLVKQPLDAHQNIRAAGRLVKPWRSGPTAVSSTRPPRLFADVGGAGRAASGLRRLRSPGGAPAASTPWCATTAMSCQVCAGSEPPVIRIWGRRVVAVNCRAPLPPRRS